MSIKPFSEVGRLAAMATGASLIAMAASGVLAPMADSGGIISGTNQGDTSTLDQLLEKLPETAALYDPSDLTSLYQSRTGGANATPGSVVGIMLDTRKMGGQTAADFIAEQPEKLSGSWSMSTSGGTATATESPSGTLNLTGDGTNSGLADKSFTSVANSWYIITFTVGTAQIIFRAGTSQGGSQLLTGAAYNVGSNTVLIRATTTTTWLRFNRQTASLSVASGVSVKEIPGYHAVAPSDAARSVCACEPAGGRRNILIYSEDFSNAAWIKSRATIVPNATAAPDGTITATKLVEDSSVGLTHRVYQSVDKPTSSAITYTASIYAKAAERNFISVKLSDNTETDQVRVAVNLTTGELSAIGGSGFTAASATAEAFENGWWRIRLTATSDSDSKIVLFAQIADTLSSYGSYNGDGASGIYIWGGQNETGSAATAYQKVVSSDQVTEAEVNTKYFLRTDGSDDWMQIFPTVNLGEQWWHVGGWRSDADTDCPFAISHQQQRALSAGTGTKWSWYISAGATDDLAVGNIRTAHILTVQQASLSSIVGRYNGTSSAAIDPYDGSSPTNGLALFTGNNSSFLLGLAGRFYGGVFSEGAPPTGAIELAEQLFSNKSGVALAA